MSVKLIRSIHKEVDINHLIKNVKDYYDVDLNIDDIKDIIPKIGHNEYIHLYKEICLKYQEVQTD